MCVILELRLPENTMTFTYRLKTVQEVVMICFVVASTFWKGTYEIEQALLT